MASFADEGIPLRVWEYSESSQTAALFCRDHGLVRGIAKGARRPKSAYSGGLEPGTRGGVVGIERQNAGALWLFTEWTLLEIFWRPRRDLRAHRAVFYMLDLTYAALSPLDPHPGLWDALLEALRSLEGGAEPIREVALYQWSVLDEAGYRLRLEAGDGEKDGAVGLDIASGRVVADPGVHNPRGVWRVRAETVRCLRELTGEESAGDACSPAAVDRAARLLAAYAQAVFDAEIRSGQALFGPVQPAQEPPEGK